MEKPASGLFGLDRSAAYTESDRPFLLARTAVAEMKTQGKAGVLFLKSQTHWGWVGKRN